MRKAQIMTGDALQQLRKLPAESVHCVVTSPPYWGLRDYGVKGQLGLERTPELYIVKMVKVFQQVKRVLRADGTVWLNMGDCYASGGRNTHGTRIGYKQETDRGCMAVQYSRSVLPNNLKEKDLVGMPWRLAFALQADGWYLRSDIIWSKPNPMPESVSDRPTKAHEYIFLLSKRPRYFYDAEAIKEPSSLFTHSRGNGINPKARKHGQHSRMQVDRDPRHLEYERNRNNGVGWGTRGAVEGEHKRVSRVKQNESFSAAVNEIVTSRNKRSVWTIATSPFPEAHFATFQPALVEICILAGTSEKGCCSKCGAPWERVAESAPDYRKIPAGWDTKHQSNGLIGKYENSEKQNAHRRIAEVRNAARAAGNNHDNPFIGKKTLAWEPTCKCKAPLGRALFVGEDRNLLPPYEPIPCTVLDPFAGAGTTGLVAMRLGRKSIGIELNPEYVEMASNRIRQDAPLFNQVTSGNSEHPGQVPRLLTDVEEKA